MLTQAAAIIEHLQDALVAHGFEEVARFASTYVDAKVTTKRVRASLKRNSHRINSGFEDGQFTITLKF
jgi:hypothetical protein